MIATLFGCVESEYYPDCCKSGAGAFHSWRQSFTCFTWLAIPMARLVSLILLGTLLVFLAITFFQVVAPFILPLFLAGVLAILCQPLQRRFLKWTGQRAGWAAGLTTVTVLAMLLVPLIAGIFVATTQLYAVAQYMLDSPRWAQTVRVVRTEYRSHHTVKEIESESGKRVDLLEWREQQAARRRVERVLSEYRQRTGKDYDLSLLSHPGHTTDDDPQFGVQVRKLSEMSGVSLNPASFRRDLLAKSLLDATLKTAEAKLGEPIDVDEFDRQLQARLFFEEVAARLNRIAPTPIDPEKLQDEFQTRVRDASQTVIGRTLGVVGSTLGALGQVVSFLISLITFVIALFYFLADGPALLEATENLIPVHRDYQRQLLTQFNQAVRAVILATFAAAVGQGIATGVGMYFLVSHRFVFFTLLSTASALVPLLGTWLVWGPGAVWLAWQGDWGSATILALYGALFVGTMDNVIRTYVLQSNVKLHPLLAFVSILGGLQVMGLWGLFVGPIVASCLHALVNIFNHELQAFSNEKFSFAAVTASPDGTNSVVAVSATPAPTSTAAGPASRDVPVAASNSDPGGATAQKVNTAVSARTPAKQTRKNRKRR